MKSRLLNFFVALALLLATTTLPVTVSAQQVSRSAGEFYALAYGRWQARAFTSTAAGATSIILDAVPPQFSPQSGEARQFNPFFAASGGAFPSIQLNDSVEILTVSAVTNCGFGASTSSGSLGACVLTTSSAANAHGAGALVTSGTFGLMEAVNDALQSGGGFVTVDKAWYVAGGTAAMILAIAPVSNVTILDKSGSAAQFYSAQPSTLSALATPATRSASAGNTQVISGTAVGTFAASTYFVCVAYVDILGGESPCSASFSFTATASVALNYASPAASAGAVGWRAYAGITGTSTQYLLALSASNCVLSTLETAYPACAIGAAGVFPDPTTASALAPGYTVNTYRPNPQSHNAFAFAPSRGGIFLQNFGPFVASAGGTTGQIEVLGTVPLPSGALNYIFKSIRVSGHITMTAGTSETPVLKVQLGPTFSTGTPTNICQFANTTALSAAVYQLNFSCTMTVNATGASGSVVPQGFAVVALGAGTTAGTAMPELGTAAITDNLSGVNNIYVTYIPTSGTNTAAQLLDAHVEFLN